jgi:hypothetical protein
VCNELWVVSDAKPGETANVARFVGGFAEWRAAVAAGWTPDQSRAPKTPSTKAVVAATTTKSANGNGNGRAPTKAALPKLSKDAYRRRRQVVEDDLTRLGLRKSQLELQLSDPRVQANFVELRRVSSELADVDAALAQAEDAWLVLSEQAPR